MKEKTKTIHLDLDMHKEMKTIAAKKGISLREAVCTALLNYIRAAEK